MTFGGAAGNLTGNPVAIPAENPVGILVGNPLGNLLGKPLETHRET